jgi:hypothetical protein
VGFIGMNAVNLVLFEDRSLKLTLINAGYPLVTLNIVAVVLALWR